MPLNYTLKMAKMVNCNCVFAITTIINNLKEKRNHSGDQAGRGLKGGEGRGGR